MLVQAYSALPQVTAIALGGSRASVQEDSLSDFDVYIFTTAPIPLDLRRDLAARFDTDPEIANPWWGDEDA